MAVLEWGIEKSFFFQTVYDLRQSLCLIYFCIATNTTLPNSANAPLLVVSLATRDHFFRPKKEDITPFSPFSVFYLALNCIWTIWNSVLLSFYSCTVHSQVDLFAFCQLRPQKTTISQKLIERNIDPKARNCT